MSKKGIKIKRNKTHISVINQKNTKMSLKFNIQRIRSIQMLQNKRHLGISSIRKSPSQQNSRRKRRKLSSGISTESKMIGKCKI